MKEKFKYIVFAVVLLIPFMYSFFYLKSYWDPYGNMKNIPVALVNNDEGEKGKEILDNLAKTEVLDFSKVSEKEASKGLTNKKYYAVITIPKDFTKDLESATKEEKVPATITYSPNQKSNYLASQIINRVVLNVEKEVRSEVSEEVVKTLTKKIKEVPEKLDEIEEGTEKLEEGSNTLSNGLNTLSNKYTEFDNGVSKLYNGSESLNNGISQVNNGISSLQEGSNNLNNGVKQINEALSSSNTDNLTALTSGINDLYNGASSLNTSVSAYVDGTEAMANGISTLNQTLNGAKAQYEYLLSVETDPAKINQYAGAVAALNSILTNSGYTSLVYGSNSLLDTSTYGVTSGTALKVGTNRLYNGTVTLNNSTSKIQSLGSSINSLKENLSKVQNGTETLYNGVNTLKSGNEQLLNGSTELTNGLQTLKSSSNEVQDGINKLSSGSIELTNGITTLKEAVKNGNDNTKEELKKLDGLDKFTANPVEIDEKDVGKVTEYGVSFTPLFLSIGLWVGALMCYVVLYYDQSHRFGILDKENRGIKQNLYYMLISIVFGLITAFLVKNLIGYKVTSTALYYFSSILISLTFMSIIQFLIRVFSDIGKFLALIILVLQLASSGGTFPVETIDNVFKGFTNILPMTYSINLIKEAVISTTKGMASTNILVLFVFLIVTSLITLFYDLKKNGKNN